MIPGILVLDNNCYALLRDRVRLERVRANLRVADLIAQPSEVNLVESTSAPDAVRRQLVATIREVAGRQPLLPWPFTMLQAIGKSIAEGKPTYTVAVSGKEWYLDDFDALSERSTETLRFQEGIEAEFAAFHARNRQKVKASSGRGSASDDFGAARPFLERVWFGSKMRRDFAEVMWLAFQLPGVAPFEVLERNEAWRLMLDAEGVAFYEQVVAHEQPRRVHRFDLMQMPYLGIARKRVLATSDRGLLRAANAVLRGRYRNARAIDIQDLV